MEMPAFLRFTPAKLRAQHNVLGRLDRFAEKLGDYPHLRAASERLEAFERLTRIDGIDGTRL